MNSIYKNAFAFRVLSFCFVIILYLIALLKFAYSDPYNSCSTTVDDNIPKVLTFNFVKLIAPQTDTPNSTQIPT